MATWNEATGGADITLSNVDPAVGRANLGAVGFADVQQFGPIVLSLVGTDGFAYWRPRFDGTLVSVAGVVGVATATSGNSILNVEVNSVAVHFDSALQVGAGESSKSCVFDANVTAFGAFTAGSDVSLFITGTGTNGNLSVTIGYTRAAP